MASKVNRICEYRVECVREGAHYSRGTSFLAGRRFGSIRSLLLRVFGLVWYRRSSPKCAEIVQSANRPKYKAFSSIDASSLSSTVSVCYGRVLCWINLLHFQQAARVFAAELSKKVSHHERHIPVHVYITWTAMYVYE
jgi:hypothetical protein